MPHHFFSSMPMGPPPMPVAQPLESQTARRQAWISPTPPRQETLPVIVNLEDYDVVLAVRCYWESVFMRCPPAVDQLFDHSAVLRIVRRSTPRKYINGKTYRSWPTCHSGWQSFLLLKFLRLEKWMGIHRSSRMRLGCFSNWREAAEHHKTKPVFPTETEFWALFIMGTRKPKDKNKIYHFEWSPTFIRRIEKCQLQHLLPLCEGMRSPITPKDASDTFWDGYTDDAFARHLEFRTKVPASQIITRSRLAQQSMPGTPPQ
ncbi:hypothetical protein OQA88_8274 [Cercophora sp. LCS_1]